MSTLVVLLLGLTVATCLIAYWSDNLGKNLGKKRVSLFNLRPRQTATLITMASSVGIMLFTIAALLATNRSIRNALLHFDAVRRELSVVQSELSRSNRELTTAQNRTRNEQTRATNAESHARQASTRARDAEKKAAATSTKLRSVQTSLTKAESAQTTAQQGAVAAFKGQQVAQRGQRAAEAQARQAEARVSNARVKLLQTGALLSQAEARLTQANARLSQAQTRVVQAETRVTQAQARARQAQNQLRLAQNRQRLAEASARKTVFGARRTLQAATRAVEAATNQYETLDAQLKTRNVELNTRQTELAEVQNQVSDAKAQLAQVAGFAGEYLQVAQQFSTGNIIDLSPNRVMSSRALPARPGRAALIEAVNAMQREGSAVARERGARDGAELQPILLNVDNGQRVLGPDEVVRGFVDFLENSPTPVSIRLTPYRYHAVGETKIHTSLMSVPITRAFANGETLASTSLQPGDGDARLFKALLALINAGEVEARKRQVNPVLTLEEPNFYASGSNERLFEVLRRVQSQNAASVSVRLIAADDLNTVEPLRVRFEIGGSLFAPSS